MSLLRLHPRDSVAISIDPIVAGSIVDGINAQNDIPSGHKIAMRDIASGEAIIKYGRAIGRSAKDGIPCVLI